MCPKKETFAMTYNDDAQFFLIVFNKDDISRKFNLNKIIDYDIQ